MISVSPLSTLVLAGAINSSFALPMKFTRKWQWENTWLVFSAFALIVFPVALAWFLLPGFADLYWPAGVVLLKIVLFGILWGIGQVSFGFALDTIGISLSTAIMLGISTALGTLVPLAATARRLTAVGVLPVIVGVALAVVGVVLCACAGYRCESGGYANKKGIVFAIAAGLGAGIFNFSMAFGGPLITRALNAGSEPGFAQLAAWTPFLLSGALANVGFCAFRLIRRKTFLGFAEPGTRCYWLGGVLMAGLWLGSALLYGVAVREMGDHGAVFAWPVYMSLIVMGTAIVGAMAGEWRGASRRNISLMAFGLGTLIIAVFVISRAHGL